MARGIFVHRTDSIYDDSPAERYQFPRQYLGRVTACIGDWIIYYEPRKVRDTRGYFAVAKVAGIVPDPTADNMYLALIEPGTYLDFPNPVPFNRPLGVVERGVLNAQGRNSGRAQAAVRPLALEDFNRIIDLGLVEDEVFLPRADAKVADEAGALLQEDRPDFIFEIERDRVASLGSRLVRDRVFRRRVVANDRTRRSWRGIASIASSIEVRRAIGRFSGRKLRRGEGDGSPVAAASRRQNLTVACNAISRGRRVKPPYSPGVPKVLSLLTS